MANIKAKELVSTNPVVVFSKKYCPFCASVKKVSNQLGATYKAVELYVESDGSDIQAALAKSTGQRTVPNVFIGGNHIGGCDITTGMHKKGKLIPLLTLPFLNYIPVSAFSSSSLQTISNSKSLSNPLYHFLPDSQNPNNLVNLIDASLKQEKGTHLALLQKNDLKGLLTHLGPNEISRVLLRCQSNYVSALTFFNWVKNDLAIKPSTYNYCLTIHILTWSREFKQAMNLLTELVKLDKDYSRNEDVFQSLVLCSEDCNWDPVVFDMLMKAYVKVGMLKEGFRTFGKIVELGYVPSVISCNHLLNGLLKLNLIGQCWKIYEVMGRLGIHPNSCTFNILTHIFCCHGDIDQVNGFLEKMEDEGFEPDIVTYNTLISSYCRKGRLSDAFYLYKIMYIRGVVPDLVSYTALMNGLCIEGKIRDAHQLLHGIVQRGLNPDIVTYNTLIQGYCSKGKIQESRLLIHEMIGNGILPDDFTCRIFVEGCRKEGKILSALNLVVQLEQFGVSISWSIYNDLIVSVCDEGHAFAAKSLLERISQHGYVPDVIIYNKIVQSLCKSEGISDALLLKSEMVHRKIKLDLVTYGALICCLCRISRCREAEALMEEMVQFALVPDPEICRALIHGYCNEGDIGKAESLLVSFGKEFGIFDDESYNILVGIFGQDGNLPKLITLQDRLLKVGYVPNKLTCKYIINCLSKTIGPDKENPIAEEWLWGFDAVALHQPVEDKTELQEMLPSDPTKRLSLTWYLEDGDLATAEEV